MLRIKISQFHDILEQFRNFFYECLWKTSKKKDDKNLCSILKSVFLNLGIKEIAFWIAIKNLIAYSPYFLLITFNPLKNIFFYLDDFNENL